MRAFIRIQHSGDFYDQNCYSVYHGCSKLDIPIVRYKAIYSVTDNAPTDLVVGAGCEGCVRAVRCNFTAD